MAMNELRYDALGQACRVGIERSLMGLVHDLLQGRGKVWSDCIGACSCCESGEDNRGSHDGVKEGM